MLVILIVVMVSSYRFTHISKFTKTENMWCLLWFKVSYILKWLLCVCEQYTSHLQVIVNTKHSLKNTDIIIL